MMGTTRLLALFALFALLVLSAGCASTHEGAIDPGLFPRAAVAPERRIAGRMALLVPPQVRAVSYDALPTIRVNVRLPIGRIVEQAALAALGDAMGGGVQPVEALPPGGGVDATLVVDAVRAEYHRRLSLLIPAPPPLFYIDDYTVDARLAFDLRLVDAQGRTVWTRTYDTGAEIMKHESIWKGAATPEGLVRIAHDAAWRLWQQAVADLRDWLAAERNKLREL
jgi:hypothetical protein